MTGDLTRSNSLADLAARIRAEREAVTTSLRHSVEREVVSAALQRRNGQLDGKQEG
jgi:hypothetical protein